MNKSRRQHSAAFKAKVAVAAIKEELSQAQITSEYGVHTTQLRAWKKQAMEAITEGFSQKKRRDKAEEANLLASLYEQIGRLQAELNWLKKKSGLDD